MVLVVMPELHLRTHGANHGTITRLATKKKGRVFHRLSVCGLDATQTLGTLTWLCTARRLCTERATRIEALGSRSSDRYSLS
jgi:hypothetical protein